MKDVTSVTLATEKCDFSEKLNFEWLVIGYTSKELKI